MPNDFEFSLLENGLDFLLASLEHLAKASSSPASQVQDPAQKRHAKYALLHLCSSIELIFKERLRQEHWSLVFHDISKASQNAYDSGDFKSVDFQEALDRLLNICEVGFTTDQRRDLKTLRDRRNKIEHFGTVDSLLALQASTSKMVSFLINFIESAFEADSLRGEAELIAEVRTKLGTCNAVVEQRWKEIKEEVAARYSTMQCPTCQQKALGADSGTVKCLFCNYTADSERAADDYAVNVLGFQSRWLIDLDGGEWPVRNCPECGRETLVAEETELNGSQRSYCFNCGREYEPGELEKCFDCGELYDCGEESGMYICSECFQKKIDKD